MLVKLVNLTKVARQILMLPSTTTNSQPHPQTTGFNVTALVTQPSAITNPQTTRFNVTALVAGLIAAIVMVLLLLIILAAVIVIYCKLHQKRM